MEYDFSQQIKDFAKISQRNSCVPHYECVCSVLEAKVERNNDVSENQVTLEQLKKVYRRGYATYSHSHLVNKTRGQLALARVNKFLKLSNGENVGEAYSVADKDLLDGKESYYVEKPSEAFVGFTDLELDLACIDLIKAGIQKCDQDVDCFDLENTEEEKKTLNKPFKMISEDDKFGVWVKSPDNGKNVLVEFEKRRVRASLVDLEVTDPMHWSAKFWVKKPTSESISSDAIEWDDEEEVTQWYWDESSFVDYEELKNSKV